MSSASIALKLAQAFRVQDATKWILVVLAGLLCATARAQMEYQITFDITPSDRAVEIVPRVMAAQAATIRYELVARKSGGADVAVSRQAGTAKLDGRSSQPLSRLKLSVRPEERYTITLKIFEGSAMVAEKTFTYPAQEET